VARMQAAFLRLPGAGSLEKYPGLRRLVGRLILLAVVATMFASTGEAEEDELAKLSAQSDIDYNTGRYSEAVPVAERIVALSRERFGEADPRYAAALNGLATFLQFTGSLDRAEQLLRLSLAIDVAALGPDHPDVATREANLALVLLDKGNSVEAASLLNRALTIAEHQPTKAEGYGATLANFAAALERLNRRKEAEQLYLAAIAEMRAQTTVNSARLAVTLGNLGILYKTEQRFGEAGPLLEEALSLLEGLSTPDAPHPRLASAINNLGTLFEDEKDYAKAEPLYKRALELDRAMFGPDSPRLAIRFSNLAGMYVTEGRLADAAPALKEAMRIDRAAFGDDDPRIAQLFLGGARLLVARKDWEHAHELISRSVEIMAEADARRAAGSGKIAAGRDIPDVSLSQIVYETALQIDGEWPWTDTSQFAKLGAGAFDVAQRLVTPVVAAAIQRMAQRYASGDPTIAATVRQQQDLAEQWDRAEGRIIAQFAQPVAQLDHDVVTAERRSQASVEQQLQQIDARLRQGGQGYAELSGAHVLTIMEVQHLLADDEALVYFADDRVHIHAFYITKERAAWSPLALGSTTIADDVQALRCGLDVTAWLDARAERCRALLHINYTYGDAQNNEELPFDLSRAHELYEALFGKLGMLIQGKRLIVVPTGALATLPFQILITETPDASLVGDERYRKAAWLIRRQPITVLPSVGSLAALRSLVPKDRATQPFIGLGNPLLDGPPHQGKELAALARARQSCATVGAPLIQKMAEARLETARGADTAATGARELMPLPETADELCAIAKELGVGDDDVLLGDRATKKAVVELSETGRLGEFSIIHFATHGLVSGDLQGLTEPALVLTPAAKGDDDDNGVLTASDIAALRLNADWVVLSSCNTAAGSANDDEAFSGLARAFFFAGARTLMVSHWEVYSEAAVALTTGTYKELQTNPIDRAEALRRSMLALLDRGNVQARPAYWAPFVVVGIGK
jgi:CHAT domain-containing protein/tetratricopeptide (TPR) repeat protein